MRYAHLVLAPALVSLAACGSSSGSSGGSSSGSIPTDDMVFVSERDGNPEIYSYFGGVVQRVTNTTVSESEPALSPDGTKIVFVSNTSLPTTLWIMNSDGSSPLPLPLPADCNGVHSPHWDPTGTMIVYSRFSTNFVEQAITIMQYPAGSSQDIIYGFDPQFGPAVAGIGSPTILFGSRFMTADGNSEIWMCDSAGMNAVPLTNSLGIDDLTPVYFAAENRIAWVEWIGVNDPPYTGSILRKMELDGSGKTNVFSVFGFDPDWPTGAGGTLYFTTYDGITEKIRKLKPDGSAPILDFGGFPDTTPSVMGG